MGRHSTPYRAVFDRVRVRQTARLGQMASRLGGMGHLDCDFVDDSAHPEPMKNE